MERRLHASQPQPRFWRISLEGLELVIRSVLIGGGATLPAAQEDPAAAPAAPPGGSPQIPPEVMEQLRRQLQNAGGAAPH